MIRAALVLAIMALAAGTTPEEWNMINAINSAKLSWKAAPNHITSMDKDARKRLLGAWKDPQLSSGPRYTPPVINADIPLSFDSRQKWPNCTTITSIKDNGSIWATASAAAMSDRLCIATRGRTNVQLSTDYLIDCCRPCNDGAAGGFPLEAWKFFVYKGVVTEDCEPPGTGRGGCDQCTNSSYKIPLSQDKHYGNIWFYFDQHLEVIQQEIMSNGPVVAIFAIYSDFITYKSGVYQKTSDKLYGYYTARVIGWGVEDGVDYWLAAHCWGTDWGENGFFKIRRGTNECGFEDMMMGGQALK